VPEAALAGNCTTDIDGMAMLLSMSSQNQRGPAWRQQEVEDVRNRGCGSWDESLCGFLLEGDHVAASARFRLMEGNSDRLSFRCGHRPF
jgi:hypothetical protein